MVLGRDAPCEALPGHERRLGFSLRGGLDPGNPEEVEEAVALLYHLRREAGGLHRLRPRLLEVPDRDRLPPLPLRALLDLHSGVDRAGLPPGSLAVEDENGLDPRPNEIARTVDESAEMGRDPPLAVVERSAIGLADDREELVQGVERVDCEDLPPEVLEDAPEGLHKG